MRNVYRVLALLVAAGVVVQGAAIAYGFFGLSKWIAAGGTLDKSSMEDPNTTFRGVGGLAAHGINGTTILPVVVLLLVVSSFFAKIPGGVKWALIVLGCTAVQILLGLFGGKTPFVGLLHGGFALVLFGVAVMAAMRARVAPASTVAAPNTTVQV